MSELSTAQDRATEPPAGPPPVSRPPRGPRAGLWARMGIQSKLLTMLLLTSIVSALLVGYFGYRSGSHSLREAAVAKVVSVRDARTRAIQSLFVGLRRSLVLNSANATAQDAMRDLTRDFAALQHQPTTPQQRASVRHYYRTVWLPSARANVAGDLTPQAFLPTSNAQWYLQSHYTAPNNDFDQAIKVDDAGDGSQWSKDHARYNPYFRQVVTENSFEDAMLVDTNGNVVYTAYKGIDLGTNILTGPYQDTGLEAAFRNVLHANAVNTFTVTDFEPYTPSGDAPAAFGLSPIGKDGKVTGVLVVQLPIESINNVMTVSGDWRTAGYGDTGESFLVGPDLTMRSTSRTLLEDPTHYAQETVDNGTPPATAAEIVKSGNPILRQSITTPDVSQALEGKSGTVTDTDYLGNTVITAYGPAKIDGLNWAVLAQVEDKEALRPVSDFLRAVALSILALVLMVTVASVLLARAFSRPVSRLLDGVRAVAAGDLDARVELRSRDEFASLAGAFNEMASSLRNKQDLLDGQLAENDRLLLTMMPQPVADRFREGEQNIVDEHVDVSVLFATVEGFDEFAVGKQPADALALLNDLFARLEAVAEASGVERVRTLRSGFVACCGLTVPRVDHATRIVDYAKEIELTVGRFNAEQDAELELRVGLDSGSVTTGLVGTSSLYDMWGDSVNVAFSVQSVEDDPGIYLSQSVYDRVRELYPTEAVGTVTVKRVEQQVWRLVLDGDRG